jgi:hypothetical protein
LEVLIQRKIAINEFIEKATIDNLDKMGNKWKQKMK